MSNFKNYKSPVKSHTVEKTFECSDCGKMFRERWDLKKHPSTGTTCKSIPVRSLLFVTSARENLRQAQLWKGIPWNTRVRGHINANVCNKLFGRGTDLRGHLRIHTRERPYSCTMCGKKFYSWLKLNRHKNIHAREASRTSKKDSAQSHSGSNTAEIIK